VSFWKIQSNGTTSSPTKLPLILLAVSTPDNMQAVQVMGLPVSGPEEPVKDESRDDNPNHE